ncbi:thioeseterase [Roseovarius sp. TE539]|uniref:acyl-CoA thioesterase n=1 Tax=Roseovarius sp. TE539 TaxID=2249812 RepID=UPI000DDEC1AF|nr:acyl-CoA thioesterase [Roseovarius sp. TE539]RBI67594.1 thioeseterase [Roseovarius sp. TE539]
MYPVLRLIWQMARHRRAPSLPPTGTHVSHHRCLPWDIDLWRELNNGRTLTLYDLGRIPLAGRIGLIAVLKRNRWGLTMAGASVRYRHRVRVFDRVRMQSRLAGWDARFFYVEQSMWRRDGACANHILYRAAVTGRDGIVAPSDVLTEMGHDGAAPALPDWITAWIDAEAQRPWPPEQE